MNNYSLAVQAIKDRLSMAEITKYYGLQIDKAGFSHCPFHTEKTASFKIYPTSAHCFGCGWGGDGIAFVREYFDLDFPAALNKINDDFQLGLPLDRRLTLREQIDANRRHRERVAERKRIEADRIATAELYNSTWGEWCRLDRNRIRLAPVSPGETLDPLFVEALQKEAYQAYLIDLLPAEWKRGEEDRDKNGVRFNG